MATDHCETYNINLASFKEEEKNILKEYMPEASSMNNPIDII
jgi:acyl-CoA synthetase (NDP forming)